MIVLEGPPKVARAATQYSTAAFNYYDAILAVAQQAAQANSGGAIREFTDDNCRQASTVVAEKNAEFVGAAREVLGGDV
ncbi:hypothetical protein GCM10010306_012680 [Streptomyces umbrinus]|nr:hypothetical protein GCM10010306_012680 [Streptomyces umbrinus]